MLVIRKYYATRDAKLYNERGGDTGKTVSAGQALTVVGLNVAIPLRGECYEISAPHSGYIPEDRVRWVDEEASDEPPPPAPVEEYILHFKDGVVRKFIPQ